MTPVINVLLGMVCSVVILVAAPAQAGGGARVGSYQRYDRVYRHYPYHSFSRYRRPRVYYHYRPPLRRYRPDYRYREYYGRPVPPYSGSIEGEMADFYRSRPKVSVHYGADAPIWSEEHVVRDLDTSQAILHIMIASPSGEVSVDEHDLGHVGQWTQGQMRLALSPGRYTVHLRRDGSVYSREVKVYEGMATIVKAGVR